MMRSSIVFRFVQIGLMIWRVCIMWLFGATSVSSEQVYAGIGVNYGMVANNLPKPTEVAQLIQNSNIRKIKIYTADSEVLRAFENTGIGVVVGLPDEMIPIVGRSPNDAQAWVKERIAAFYPATTITYIAVGNEILAQGNQVLNDQLVPAMENIHKALVSLGMDQIKVSTPNSMGVLTTSYPPSSGTFQPNIIPVIKSLLDFLSRTGSSFMVNVYPYFAYSQNPHIISLDYALFRINPGVTDSKSGLHYTNLFDAQVDAVYYAMIAAGNNQVPLIVSETGWPSAGDPNEVGSGLSNAQQYNNNLIKHVTSTVGTPYKPGMFIDTYIFALFNENLKPGPSSERNFGLLYPDKSSVYNVGLFKSTSTHSSPQTTMSCKQTPARTTSSTPTYTQPTGSSSQNRPATWHPTDETTTTTATTTTTPVWCVADSQAGTALLQQSLDYACGNGADCSEIQAGKRCFWPNTLVAHASFAFNSYFQRMGRQSWNCFFDNAAFVTTTNPSYADCTYPSN